MDFYERRAFTFLAKDLFSRIQGFNQNKYFSGFNDFQNFYLFKTSPMHL